MVNDFVYPLDFNVIDFDEDQLFDVSILLGHLFLATSTGHIYCRSDRKTMDLHDFQIEVDIFGESDQSFHYQFCEEVMCKYLIYLICTPWILIYHCIQRLSFFRFTFR